MNAKLDKEVKEVNADISHCSSDDEVCICKAIQLAKARKTIKESILREELKTRKLSI